MIHRWKMLVPAAAVVLLAVGCSSSSKSSSSTTSPATSGATASGSSGGGKTYTVGLLSDFSGAGANLAVSFKPGIEAGIGLAKQEGYNIKFVEADTTSSPTGALAAAEKLVEEDHVLAVFMNSVVGFGAAPYLASHGIPVYGAAGDGPEWISDRNMFSILGYEDYTTVQTTYGEFYKARGVTNLASVGYGIEPSSYETAKGVALSAEHEGIKVGYLNLNFPLGSTNVGPLVLGMKDAGVDGLSTSIITNSTFAIIQGLEQQGVHLKAAIPPVGYGGDLVQGGPGAQQEAQGVYFISGWEPVEMHTAATKKFQNALSTYGGVTGEPTFDEYIGYLTVDAFVQGLKQAGPNPSQAQLINATLGITNYTGQGLWGGRSIGFDMAFRGKYEGADNCIWFTQYEGTTFHLVPGATPLCGQTIPGLKA
jgi:ABC-type branched-subunit amino acid transport system substrate-binding protein